MLAVAARDCVSREFTTFALGRTGPIAGYLRRLAAHAHAECVGAVGMCFTGNFALAMAVYDRMLAPVLSQPGLPIPIGRRHRADVNLSAEDLATIKRRAAEDGSASSACGSPRTGVRPGERVDTLRRELGDAFIAVEIDSSPRQPARHPVAGTLGAHPRPGRRAGPPDPARARPGDRLLPRTVGRW
jgi:hypothetical protein